MQPKLKKTTEPRLDQFFSPWVRLAPDPPSQFLTILWDLGCRNITKRTSRFFENFPNIFGSFPDDLGLLCSFSICLKSFQVIQHSFSLSSSAKMDYNLNVGIFIDKTSFVSGGRKKTPDKRNVLLGSIVEQLALSCHPGTCPIKHVYCVSAPYSQIVHFNKTYVSKKISHSC